MIIAFDLDPNLIVNIILAIITLVSTMTTYDALKLQERQTEINYMPNFIIKVNDIELPANDSQYEDMKKIIHSDTQITIKNNSEHQISEVFLKVLIYIKNDEIKNYILPKHKLNCIQFYDIDFLDNQSELIGRIPYNYHQSQINQYKDSSIPRPELLIQLKYKTKFNRDEFKIESFKIKEMTSTVGEIERKMIFNIRQIRNEEFNKKYKEIEEIQYPNLHTK
ncbi:hypothetical protein [Macrococcoides bohemicum]|uniref:hypothetical protein n=1 Tax=Macrococcoides bohemicum TaxID=1903056 RepID=UPI0028AE8F8D|nr:hypothetical protein [Macrococcus bohemicus]